MFRNRGLVSVQVLGRLRPGATITEARAAVQTVFAGLATEYPGTNRNRTVKAASYGRFPVQNRIFDLIAVVGISGLLAVLLLIICGNLAGMALARSAARKQEIGVRLALGSSRVRLVRHLMVEVVILTVIGGGVGIVLAMTAMTRVSPMDLGISAPGVTFEPSGWTLAMSLALSLVAAQAFGFLPAFRFSRPELVSDLKDDNGGSAKLGFNRGAGGVHPCHGRVLLHHRHTHPLRQSPVDPISFLSVGVLLLFVVITASLVPALRVSGIHPMEALRKD